MTENRERVASHEIGSNGEFKRQKSEFTCQFGSGENESPIESGRYRLLVVDGCPWCHRTMIVMKMLGLDEHISIGKASSIQVDKKAGWPFSLDKNHEDPVLKIKHVTDIYLATDPNYDKRATVPVLVDLKTKKVINNDFYNLTKILERDFKPLHKQNALDLYPKELENQLDEMNKMIFDDINNGVYKTGFATSQAAYESNYDRLFMRLDWLEEHFSKNRYLMGDRFTDADIRLFVTLVRFDTAYYPVFRCNRNLIVQFSNIWNYCKELYNIPEIKETTNFYAFKSMYWTIDNNPYGIIPKGPDLSVWNEDYHR
ncbi:glutathione S-transferase C-terminal domain-containing protein [Facklamia hominis]|uniref:Glutathione S-transferase C-terminal domain-containing protein n=1 Tax=Facklamia hominis TaxID=178214 RepID=A0AAJ1V1M3_9LACT|nr:glutathione S-transferase C-terminal domain-containing protein [Facklamia hominis]EPH09797.1 hypothetical protein HMPREF9260_01245 [Facklamia hominis ACS-120-V-Sch10]MDK7186680.1 glutathione S-transferase C-terminal domain-containing protein [Facklamia hominis]